METTTKSAPVRASSAVSDAWEKGDSGADYYLDWAKKIFAFTKENLKNQNNLYGA